MADPEPLDKNIKKILAVDDTIHAPGRLALLMFLIPHRQASFVVIRKALDMTAGKLSNHLKKLEANDLIVVEKRFIKLKPTTLISITKKGRKDVINYASQLSNVFASMLDTHHQDIHRKS